jgi:hypothetical protein
MTTIAIIAIALAGMGVLEVLISKYGADSRPGFDR